MKTLTCDLCDFEAQGKDFNEWSYAIKPHYANAHPNMLSDPSAEDIEKWVAKNTARFDAV